MLEGCSQSKALPRKIPPSCHDRGLEEPNVVDTGREGLRYPPKFAIHLGELPADPPTKAGERHAAASGNICTGELAGTTGPQQVHKIAATGHCGEHVALPGPGLPTGLGRRPPDRCLLQPLSRQCHFQVRIPHRRAQHRARNPHQREHGGPVVPNRWNPPPAPHITTCSR